jgi:8-oxo-dGTP pyrophosphatase MutT (NUDIX family)
MPGVLSGKAGCGQAATMARSSKHQILACDMLISDSQAIMTERANRQAAVIVPVFKTASGEPSLLLVRRSAHGVHGGQIAFPGGMREESDATLLDTALRELREELAIAAHDVEVLANLEPMQTLTTNLTVSPFVARMLKPGAWKPSELEIAEVLETPVKHFANPESHDYGLENFAGWTEPRRVPFYHLGEHRVWGLTYRILQIVVPRLVAGEWPS